MLAFSLENREDLCNVTRQLSFALLAIKLVLDHECPAIFRAMEEQVDILPFPPNADGPKIGLSYIERVRVAEGTLTFECFAEKGPEKNFS